MAMETARRARETTNGQQKFLTLPAELRNRIYEHVYPGGGVIVVGFCPSTLQDTNALTQVCRAIRAETIPILYGTLTFYFELDDSFPCKLAFRWFRSLDSQAISSLRALQFNACMVCDCWNGRSYAPSGGEIEDVSTGITVTIDLDKEHGPTSCKVEPCGLCNNDSRKKTYKKIRKALGKLKRGWEGTADLRQGFMCLINELWETVDEAQEYYE